MSSTGLIDFNANYINSDIIDVNEKLTVNNIDILNLINNNFDDLSENIIDLSENVYDKIFDLSGNIFNSISNLSGNIFNSIFDLSQNLINEMDDLMNILNDLDNTVIDVSGNVNEVKNKVTDLSGNVAEIKSSNDLQELKIFGHGLQISANTDAIVSLGGILTTNVANTGANSALITGIVLTLGIPSVAGVTPSTGIYASIDSKTSRSLFGSGNSFSSVLINCSSSFKIFLPS